MTAIECVTSIQGLLAELRKQAIGGGAVAMVGDIDKMVVAADGLQEQLRTLPERAKAAKSDEAMRTIRHDLRTPVGQIRGYCELLREEAEDAGDLRFDAQLGALHRATRSLEEGLEALSQTYAGLADGDTGVYPTASLETTARSRTVQRPGTVLVVDDNADNRDLLARRLERDGYSVVTAAHGREALEIVRDREVDIVLLDVMMPIMDGYETLSALKADDELRHIPVIMLTSLSDEGSLAACIQAGAEDHLPRPFDPVLLRARLSGSLENKRARDRERRYLARILAEKKRADDLIHGVIPIGVALTGERNEARILERTVAEARRFCGADGGVLFLREVESLFVVQLQCDSLETSMSPGSIPTTPPGGVPARVRLGDARHAKRPEVIAAQQGETVVFEAKSPGDYDLSAVEAFDAAQGYKTLSLVYVPLRASADAEISGVLQLWNATRPTDGAPVHFTKSTVEMLQSLSSLAAAALVAYRRESELRHRIRRLEIKIDEQQRKSQVSEITETDYFQRLRDQASRLRKGGG